MPDWLLTESGTKIPLDGDAATSREAVAVAEHLVAEAALAAYVGESYADLEQLYREDIGWQKLGAEKSRLTPEGRKGIAGLADLAVTGNALIKRGVALRTAYVWGQGVTVSIADDGAEGQDVNAVWQAFWDDPVNRKVFSNSEAQVRYERRLATGGEAFWAFPTNVITGRVRVRKIPASEIVERITDPEDVETVWLYKRTWAAIVVNDKGERTTENRTTYYPALGYRPAARPKSLGGDPIRWDVPLRPVVVNSPEEDWRGLGDVLAALPWARMDKEFLEDLAVYMRALTRILGQVTGKNSRQAKAVAGALRDATQRAAQTPGSSAGAWAATGPDTSLSLLSKSGAQIDASSSKEFATRASAALEVPLTMLLGDPGVTGARATAETLDQPLELMAKMRREVHTELFRDVADYVIDSAVIAPAGPLRGLVTRDGDRHVVTLPDGDSRTVEVAWPEYDSTPVKDQVATIVAAADVEPDRGGLPPAVIFKLLTAVLKVKDADDLLDELTDDDGNWLAQSLQAAQVAVEAHRRGEDPAAVLR